MAPQCHCVTSLFLLYLSFPMEFIFLFLLRVALCKSPAKENWITPYHDPKFSTASRVTPTVSRCIRHRCCPQSTYRLPIIKIYTHFLKTMTRFSQGDSGLELCCFSINRKLCRDSFLLKLLVTWRLPLNDFWAELEVGLMCLIPLLIHSTSIYCSFHTPEYCARMCGIWKP